MIQTKCDRLAEDLEKEKKKIADLESTIDDLAKKELEASGQVETIRKEFAVKQKLVLSMSVCFRKRVTNQTENLSDRLTANQ